MQTILFLHHSGRVGGAGVSLLHLIDSIDRSNYSIVVYCPESPSHMADMLRQRDCEVITAPDSPALFCHFNGGESFFLMPSTLINFWKVWRDKARIVHLLNQVKPDIVAVNSMTLFWAGKIAKKMHLRTVCFHRETYARGFLGFRTRYLKHQLSKHFDKIAFISEFDLKQTGRISGIARVIYDRVNVEQFRNTPDSKDNVKRLLHLDPAARYILFLGGMSRLKGAFVVVEALACMQSQDVKLIFLQYPGSTEQKKLKDCLSISEKIRFVCNLDIEKKVLRTIKNYNLSSRVEFLRTTHDIALCYAASDVIVFPSTQPHQARPIYEAGIARIPIVISDFPNTREFVEDRQNALVFPPKDSKNLATVLDNLFTEKIDIPRMINANFRAAMARHQLQSLPQDLNCFLQG